MGAAQYTTGNIHQVESDQIGDLLAIAVLDVPYYPEGDGGVHLEGADLDQEISDEGRKDGPDVPCLHGLLGEKGVEAIHADRQRCPDAG